MSWLLFYQKPIDFGSSTEFLCVTKVTSCCSGKDDETFLKRRTHFDNL